MKGLFFNKQLEIRLDVEGEEFRQGDSVACTINVKNRGAEAHSLGSPFLALSRGDLRKVKKKAADAFEQLSESVLDEFGKLEPGESKSASWTFVLDKNCIVSDKAQSLCLCYGLGEEAESRAHLQLPVLPHVELEGIIGIFETSFQFLLKSIKSKKDWVSAVLKGPDGPGYRALNELELRLRFDEEGVESLFIFKVERLEATVSDLEVQKKKVESKRRLERREYMSTAGYVDPELLEPIIRDELSRVTSRFEV